METTLELNEAGIVGTIAKQPAGSSHRAQSANTPLPAFAHLHAAGARRSQIRQRERILSDRVIFILKWYNTQVTLGFDLYLLIPDEWR
jgi:hypothetical protein